jgi:DNA invertase Pin-like site-specific DNA recombinase
MTKKSSPTKPSTKHTTIGYLRVSTGDQELEKNKGDILSLAHTHDLGKIHFVEEIISGHVPWRKRKIAEVLDSLKANEVIVVSELSRLGRSMLECLEILSLATRKGFILYAVKGNWKLDNSIQSKIIAMAFSMAAEIERDLISQPTREALRFKKAQGLKLGRPPGPGRSKLDVYRPGIEGLLANGATQRFIAARYKTTEANLHHWLKKHAIKRHRDNGLA